MREQKVRAKWIKREVGEFGGLRRRRLTVEFLEPRHLFATLHVGAGDAFATIQQAVDHARPDDIIEVAPAVYFETVDWSQMGRALSRGPGNLTIHGADSNVILRAPQGPAIHNSTPLVGNLSLRQLIIESPTLDSGMGVSLHQVQGTITIANAVFQEIAKSAVELSQTSGSVFVIDNQFIHVAAATEEDAFLNAAAANGEAESESESDRTTHWAFQYLLFGLFRLEESSGPRIGQRPVAELLGRRRSS